METYSPHRALNETTLLPGQQRVAVTMRTLHPHESVFEATASQVISKFLLYMQRQGPALQCHHIPELRVVSFDDLGKKCPFRPVALVWRAE